MKSLRQARWSREQSVAVIGLGNMGLLHMLAAGRGSVGYELNASRKQHAESLGMKTYHDKSEREFDIVFVCPGTHRALELGLELVAPRGTLLLFAPFGENPLLDLIIDRCYFKDVTLATSYSAGPDDTVEALRLLRAGTVKAEQVVSDFVSIDELPAMYEAMKRGEILKAMVSFDHLP